MFIRKLSRPIKHVRFMNRITMGLARAAATSGLRQIDERHPNSWEFCALSQSGEDGIIDFLTRKILRPNSYFIEIGSGDGMENNTSWLAIARRFSGLMVEGNPKTYNWCRDLITPLNSGVETLCLFVNRENQATIQSRALHKDPDVFSLDVDFSDYFLAEGLFEAGFRPKISVVEFNSAFGPDRAISVKLRQDAAAALLHHRLYYGCSIEGWKRLFRRFGYRFLTVESNGQNAFFIDPQVFDSEFVQSLRGLEFRENVFHARELHLDWSKQFELIKDMDFFEIPERTGIQSETNEGAVPIPSNTL